MKIGIFGGTFNPIHYGHLRAAEEIQERFSFDRIFFMPAGRPPFRKPSLISALHRFRMAAIALKGNKSLYVSDIEVKNRSTSYSVDTINKLRDTYTKSDFFFIIGVDAFLDMPKWNQPFRLTELTNFVIISRPGFSFSMIASSPYLSKADKRGLTEFDEGKKTEKTLHMKSGKQAVLFKITGLDISSTRIRELIRKGKSIKYLLPESAESYIISRKLYGKVES